MDTIFPGESDSLTTGWPLHSVIFMTMLMGLTPVSWVRLVPMPNDPLMRSRKRRQISAALGTSSESEKIRVRGLGSTRVLGEWAILFSPHSHGSAESFR